MMSRYHFRKRSHTHEHATTNLSRPLLRPAHSHKTLSAPRSGGACTLSLSSLCRLSVLLSSLVSSARPPQKNPSIICVDHNTVLTPPLHQPQPCATHHGAPIFISAVLNEGSRLSKPAAKSPSTLLGNSTVNVIVRSPNSEGVPCLGMPSPLIRIACGDRRQAGRERQACLCVEVCMRVCMQRRLLHT